MLPLYPEGKLIVKNEDQLKTLPLLEVGKIHEWDFRAEIWTILLPYKVTSDLLHADVQGSQRCDANNLTNQSCCSVCVAVKRHYISGVGRIGLGHQVLPRHSCDVKVKLWLQTAGDWGGGWQIWLIRVAELCINSRRHKRTANGVPSDGCKETVIPPPSSNRPDLSAPNDEKKVAGVCVCVCVNCTWWGFPVFFSTSPSEKQHTPVI